VLTTTPHSYGKGQNSTLYKIETPKRILTKFGTVDYIEEICPQTKFGDDRISGGLWVNMCNIRCLLRALILFIQTLALYKSSTYLLTYFLT